MPGMYVGHPLAILPDGLVQVQLHDGSVASVLARVASPLDREAIEDAIKATRDALVAFAQGCDEGIIMAILVPPAEIADPAPKPRTLSSRHKVIMKSGKAVITLHPSGKVQIAGVSMVSRTSQDQWIQGRLININ